MMAQYSPEWWEVRRGIPTASQFDKILTPTGKASAQADDYAAELIGDICCLNPNFLTERPMTRAMANGRDMEPEARRWFEMEKECRVQQVGFCVSDDGRFGCSPDGLVGEDSVLELKCPMAKTQVKYLLDGGLPAEYRPQCHGHLLVTGRPVVWFCSYAPGLPGLIVKVVPDEYTVKLAAALAVFSEKFQAAKAKIGGM